MKVILIISLITNSVLAFLLVKKEKPPIRERLIIETHADFEKPEKMHETRDHVGSRVPSKPKTDKKINIEPKLYIPENSHDLEVQDAGEKMEAARVEYLTNELRIPEEVLLKHQELRNEYFKETGKMWDEAEGELNFEQKRKLVDLEENFHLDLEKLYGKKKWDRYQKFREQYNKRGFRRQTEENQPFLIMGL